MIDKSKTYRTRDGRKVRIYATDGDGSGSAIHGAIKDFYGWVATVWTSDGKCHWGAGCYGDPTPANDLIEVRPRIQRTVWLNVNPEGRYCGVHFSKEAADRLSHPDRLACVRVEIDCEEGEGL